MNVTDQLNMTMLCDFYELTMGNGYFEAGLQDRITYFDVFFREVPDHGGYAVCAGLDRIIEYILDLHFSEEDIAYLRSKQLFSERFLEYLRNFKFTGDIWAIPEGTPIFPHEPVITVRAPAIQAQLVETFLLLTFNHQSLVATKANRITRAAEGRTVLEFGSRRAQGTDAAISGARAAYIGGCAGTACTISDQLFGVPAGGTMAHAWVQMFDLGIRGVQDLLRGVPHQRHAAGGYLQYAEVRRSQCYPGIQRGSEAQGHHQMRHSAGFRRYCLSYPRGAADAGRSGLAELQNFGLQFSG